MQKLLHPDVFAIIDFFVSFDYIQEIHLAYFALEDV